MKKLILILLISFIGVGLYSCNSDDEEPDLVCLRCTSDDPDVTIEGDEVCEGDEDPDTGEEVTRADLEAAKLLFEGFGATCTLN
jgi:hypothetical protein